MAFILNITNDLYRVDYDNISLEYLINLNYNFYFTDYNLLKTINIDILEKFKMLIVFTDNNIEKNIYPQNVVICNITEFNKTKMEFNNYLLFSNNTSFIEKYSENLNLHLIIQKSYLHTKEKIKMNLFLNKISNYKVFDNIQLISYDKIYIDQSLQYFNLIKNIINNNYLINNTYNLYCPNLLKFDITNSIPIFLNININKILTELIWCLNKNYNFIKQTNPIWENIILTYYNTSLKCKINFINKLNNIIDCIISKNFDSSSLILDNCPTFDNSNMLIFSNNVLIQFFIIKDEVDKLNCHIYYKKQNMYLQFNMNIFFYSILLHIIAKITNIKPFQICFTIVDSYIFTVDIDNIDNIKNVKLPFPSINIKNITSLNNIQYNDLCLIGNLY